jgi:lysophospholipase L1-like esterase
MAESKDNTTYYLIAAALIGSFLIAKKLSARPSAPPALPGGQAALTGGAAPIAAAASASQGAPLDLKGQRVLLVGSSSTLMIEKELKAALLKEGVAEFRNVGVGGTTIRQWSDNKFDEGKTLEAELASYKPSLVIIILGTNDEGARQTRYNGPTYDVAKANAKSVARFKKKLEGVRSIFIGMPKPDLWTLDRNFRDMLAATWGPDFFRTEDLGLQKAGDKLHLSPKGYKNLVEAVIPWFRQKKG